MAVVVPLDKSSGERAVRIAMVIQTSTSQFSHGAVHVIATASLNLEAVTFWVCVTC